MGNRSYLISVEADKPMASVDEPRTSLREAKGVIPLFWWGMFTDADFVDRKVDCIQSGDPEEISNFAAWTLFQKKAAALEAFEKFAAGIEAAGFFPQPAFDYLRTLRDEIRDAAGDALQLYCDDFQFAMEPHEFRQWADDCLRFAKGARSKRVKQLSEKVAAVLELSAIYVREQRYPKGPYEPFNKQEFLVRAAELAGTPPTDVPSGARSVECADWEHSLIGVCRQQARAASSSVSPADPPSKPWWKFW